MTEHLAFRPDDEFVALLLRLTRGNKTLFSGEIKVGHFAVIHDEDDDLKLEVSWQRHHTPTP
jgi:hypothetical protein